MLTQTSTSHRDEGMAYQDSVGLDFVKDVKAPRMHYNRTDKWPIWYYDSNDEVTTDRSQGPYFPTWQSSPVVYGGLETNENILANKDGLNGGANITFTSESVAISQLIMAPPGDKYSTFPSTALVALLLEIATTEGEDAVAGTTPDLVTYQGDPLSKVYFPIYDDFHSDRKPVAIMLAWIRWLDYFANILPPTLEGVVIVLQDSCGGEFSYMVNGEDVVALGTGDLHDTKYDSLRRSVDYSSVKSIADGTKYGLSLNQDFCPISIDIYPSDAFQDIFTTQTPVNMTIAVALVFVFTTLMFIGYDRLGTSEERRSTCAIS